MAWTPVLRAPAMSEVGLSPTMAALPGSQPSCWRARCMGAGWGLPMPTSPETTMDWK